MDRLTVDALVGWVPIRLYWDGGGPMVDWCYLGEERFTDPFFDQTIERCLRRPFRSLFRPQTSIGALTALHAAHPGVPPRGFIFHLSRCGSTLIGQMLATRPEHVVLSEPGPVDMVLRSYLRDPTITDEQRATWLQAVLSAYGQRRTGREEALFVKFDSWSVFELPVIHRAFPDVPWIFLYRRPLEVLVSHARERGSQMLPGVLEPALLGLDWTSAAALSLDEYGARVLAEICAAAVRGHGLGKARFVEYGELPDVVGREIAPSFGWQCTPEEIDRLHDVARFHGKRPYEAFAPDQEAKRRDASPQLRALAERWLDPWYERLEGLRREGLRLAADDRATGHARTNGA